MPCDCEEWQIGMPQITDAQIFCANQAAGPRYTGTPFKFCPWCGKCLAPAEDGVIVRISKALIKEVLVILHRTQDKGPSGAGWKSDKLIVLIQAIEAANEAGVECDCGCPDNTPT